MARGGHAAKGGGADCRLYVLAPLPLLFPRALMPRADPSFLAAHPYCRGKLCLAAEQRRESMTSQNRTPRPVAEFVKAGAVRIDLILQGGLWRDLNEILARQTPRWSSCLGAGPQRGHPRP
jgi:hypothetical protein